MPSSLRWPDAVLAGLSCSMRSMSGPAMLAARGAITGRARPLLLLGAAGELAVDKLPVATDRIAPPALAGRLGSGAYTGYAIAGPVGAAAAAVGAGVGSYSTFRIRKLTVDVTGLPDPVIAAGEDIIAYALAAAVTHEVATPDTPAGSASDDTEAGATTAAHQTTEPLVDAPPAPSLVKNAARGLIAGLAATAVMTVAQGAEFQLTPAEPSDAPAQVAGALARRLGRGRLKRRNRAAANQGMHWLYGTSWGIPYGIVAASSRTRPEMSGPIFGLLVWGVGLAQQPAVGVAEVPWKRSLQSLGSEAFFHLVYGAGAGAALRVLRNREAAA